MRLVSLSIKNYKEIAASLQQKNQLFPFSLSNEKARQLFLAGVKEQPQKQNQVALEVNDKLVGFISYELTDTTLVLTHILKQPSFAKGLHFWVELLENLAKKKQLKQLSLCVKPYDSYLKERLVASGFDFVETSQGEWLFTRAISYKTGLVLAGGGARGAYQIGAWRALKELGITYDVICGTSVGALNGAFILQDDFAAAAELWGQIDTNQLLSFPEADFADKSSVEGMLVNMQRFAKSALATQGVSTEPLQQLIKKHLKPAEINQGAPELFICTTQLPQLREVVISFKATPVTEFPQWLLASSSFFPAMAATKIAGSYYVDGGYRNNIPVDVAVEQGATEIIVVNVKGPGITKPYTLPQGLPVVTVASPWSLGTVLLFDGSRSHWNMELGYLETMKAFDHYIGYWYTFNHQFSDGMLTRWYDLFNQQILEGAGTKTNNALIIQEILKKTRKLYSERGTQEMVSLYVLEFVAKVLEITPAKLYTIPELLQAMQMKLRTGWLERNPVEEEILLSLSEWLRHYANNLPLPTEKQQVLYLYHQLKHEHSEHLLNLAATVAPHIYLAAKTLSWLEATEGDIIDGTRI